ncbi:phosphotransferase [Xylella fastidiosa]|uniref:phosphotransferase n=1 Tax=Xylella fastidiosa TaxID=2371 RepID=UPI0004CE81A2|nr:phosphotransferase [Xylella fastidiosa]ALQ94339.1 phosphotransferase [Xylella fastidiosa]ALQ97806.1 phosphotransferase [Xylella fastidiosa]ALR02684.1 phosphotransferase [Xylella fastidiosa]ALR10086.2 phosphotransferase [Xylella fastidiosa]KXB16090.1 phosphotransferase [Xylella fastidiosa]
MLMSQGVEEIAQLVPHQGRMCFWEQVVEWDTTRIVLCSEMHRDVVHPLLCDGGLHAVHLCEYGAQAMAVHGGLLGRQMGRPVRQGVLVALRGVMLHVDRFDDLPQALHGEAEVLMQGEDSQQYRFRIFHVDQLLAEGRAVVMLG